MKHYFKTTFCIYSGYLCVILKLVWSESFKCDKYAKNKKTGRGQKLFHTVVYWQHFQIWNYNFQQISYIYIYIYIWYIIGIIYHISIINKLLEVVFSNLEVLLIQDIYILTLYCHCFPSMYCSYIYKICRNYDLSLTSYNVWWWVVKGLNVLSFIFIRDNQSCKLYLDQLPIESI